MLTLSALNLMSLNSTPENRYLCNILRPITYFTGFFQIADLAINEQQLQYPNYVKALKVWPMSDGQTQKLPILSLVFARSTIMKLMDVDC